MHPTMKFIIIYAIVLLVGQHNAQAKESISAHLSSHEELLSLLYWSPPDGKHHDYICIIVSSLDETQEPYYPRTLKIFREESEEFFTVFEFGAYDAIYSMSPFNKNKHLLTIWLTGSAFMVRIFSTASGEFTLLFEGGTEVLPEFVDIDHDGTTELLLSEGHLLFSPSENRYTRYPTVTNIYTWDGTQYSLIKTAPWKERFCHMSQ